VRGWTLTANPTWCSMPVTMQMPKTVSARDIQRNYRQIFDEVMETRKPVVVLKHNQPEVIIRPFEKVASISIKEGSTLFHQRQKAVQEILNAEKVQSAPYSARELVEEGRRY